jgi:hypothetical protein
MKKVLFLAAFVGLGAVACSSGPSASQVCMDTNAALMICFPSAPQQNCANAGMVPDGGTTCSNQSAILQAADNCATAVHAMSDCATYTMCVTNLPACMH